jgi:cell division GTPase FtsZ
MGLRGGSVSFRNISVDPPRVDLARLDHLPRENQYLIGQTDPRVKGHGAGGDPEIGAEMAQRDRHEIDRALGTARSSTSTRSS